MNGYFLTLIILQVLGCGMHLAKHGEEHKEKYNFIAKLIATLISLTLIYFAIKTGF